MGRSWVGTGLLVAGILAFIAVVPLDHGATASLAVVAVAALAARALTGLTDVRSALGEYASPLALTLELALALAAAWPTGGLRSPLLLVIAALLVLARRQHGLGAARFLAVSAVLGLAVLAAAAPAAEWSAIIAVRVLWPIAVLAAMEVALAPASSPRPEPGPREDEAAIPEAPARVPMSVVTDEPAPRAAAPARERDLRAEILHDIRSPLSVVKVYADLIAERARRGELPVDEHLANLAAEIELMSLMVEGPTAARDRRAALPNAPVDLVRLLTEITSRYRETHGDKVQIEMSAERPRVAVPADPVALQRVFRNVLDNALHYTPAGGAVRVRLWADRLHAHVVVSDTGMGMSAEELDRAFDPSFRGRGAQAVRAGGRGLGLTLSRELVEAMGGSISLWSEEDRGAEVRVLLPVAPEMAT
jgi:signal transduction histidine kinase